MQQFPLAPLQYEDWDGDISGLQLYNVRFQEDFGAWVKFQVVSNLFFDFENGKAIQLDDAGKEVASIFFKLTERKP